MVLTNLQFLQRHATVGTSMFPRNSTPPLQRSIVELSAVHPGLTTGQRLGNSWKTVMPGNLPSGNYDILRLFLHANMSPLATKAFHYAQGLLCEQPGVFQAITGKVFRTSFGSYHNQSHNDNSLKFAIFLHTLSSKSLSCCDRRRTNSQLQRT